MIKDNNIKKGFTLTELLAVIVVISLIALITVPIVANFIEKARMKAFKDRVIIAYKKIDDYLLEHDKKVDELNASVLDSEFTDGKYIKITDKTEAWYITDGRYCAKGKISNLRINKYCYRLDDTEAKIYDNYLVLSSTSKTVNVIIPNNFAIDSESGIKKYIISIYKNGVLIETTETEDIGAIEFDDLDHNTLYNIKIDVINGNDIGLESEVEKEIKTKKIETPEYIINPNTPYAQNKTVTIDYKDPDNIYTHEYSYNAGEANEEWHTYEGAIPFDENGSVTARVTDGKNYVTASDQAITGIDKTGPSASATITKITTSTVIVNATCEDSESGISKIEYSNGGEWIDNGVLTSYEFTNLSSDTDYDFKVRCTNGSLIQTESEEVGDKTGKISVTFNPTRTPSDTTYARSVSVPVTYTIANVTTPTRYISSDVAGTKLSTSAEICGSGNEPTTCNGTLNADTAMAKDTWYKVEGNVTVTVAVTTNNATLSGVIHDGNEYITAGTEYISNVDATKPTCGSLSGEGSSNSWAKTRTISIDCNDTGGSNCKQNSYTMGTVNSGTITTKQFSVEIEDGAGNKETCTSTANVYVDNDAPTQPTTMSYVYGDWSAYGGSWTKNDVYAARTSSAKGPTGSTDTGGSGVCKYQISSNNSTWYDYNYDYNNAMYHFSSSGTYTRYFRAVDCAGNPSTSISRTAYIDKSAPNVPTSTVRYDSSSGTVRGNSSSWTNRTLWWGSFSATDNGSAGIRRYEYSTNCTGTVSGTLGSSYTYDSTRDWQFCIRAVDNAENPSSWSDRYYFRIDKGTPTAPTITGGTGSDWIGHNQIIWITSDSSSSSGINRYQYCINTSNTTSGCSWRNLSPVQDNDILENEYVFDPAFYHQANSDLISAFSGNVSSLYSHFVNNGIAEGRASSQIFQFAKYKNSNGDLINAFGSNNANYFTHFKQSGMSEGRTSSDYFNYANYKSYYSDLRNAFGNDARQYYAHAYYNGISELRNLGGSSYMRKAQEITTHGLRYIFFRAVNNVETAGTASSAQVTKIGVYSQDSVCGSTSSSTTCTSSTCCGSTTKWKTCSKTGVAVSTCSSTYSGRCGSGTTSGGNCTCYYSCSYQAANTCTSSCCGSVSTTGTCWHE